MLNTKALVVVLTLGLLLQAPPGFDGFAHSAAGSFPISTDKGKQYGPIVVADTNGNRFLAVWTDLRSGREEVYGQIIDARGTLFGKQIQISKAGRNFNPSVVYDSVRRMYLVLWTSVNTDGQTGIFGRFISADGSAEDPQTIVSGKAALVDNAKTAFDPKHDRFLIIWDCYCGKGEAASNWDVRGGFFTSDLVPIAESFTITDAFNNDQFGNVSFNQDSKTFLVVWKHTERSSQLPGSAIWGQLITADMRLFGSNFPISGRPAASPAAVAADPLNGTFLVGWVDNNSESVFRALTSDANFSGTPFTTAHGVRGPPSLAYNATAGNFLAVYDSNGNIIVDHVSTAGAVGPASVVITQGTQRGDRAGLAYDPKSRSIFIAWSQANAPGKDDSDIYGTITASIAATPPPLSISSSLTPDTPANLARALDLFQAAETHWKSGEWPKAEAAYREFLRQYPDYWLAAPAHANLGFQLSFLRDREAADQFTEAIKKAPGTRTAHRAKLGMAALYYAWGEYAKARDLFREVLTESKDWDLTKYATRQLKAVNLRIKAATASNER